MEDRRVKSSAEREDPVFEKALAVCRETALQLPRMLSPPEFKPVEKRRLQQGCDIKNCRPELRAALLPIKIILYGVPEDIGVPYDWSAAVCSTFDITLCAVTLTVQTDHSFECREHEGAFSDLRSKKQRLSQTAFSTDVHAQMKRVLKYALRGCTW